MGMRVDVRLRLGAQAAVDGADVLDPAPTISVLQLQDLAKGPMEVVGEEGYLLVEPLEGVATDSPGLLTSTSKACEQAGQVVGIRAWPFSLMRRYRSWR